MRKLEKASLSFAMGAVCCGLRARKPIRKSFSRKGFGTLVALFAVLLG